MSRDLNSDPDVGSLLTTLAQKQRRERNRILSVALTAMVIAAVVALFGLLRLSDRTQASIEAERQQAGRLRTLQAENDRIERELARQTEIRRKFPEAIERGVREAENGRLARAIEAYDEALALDPQSEQAYSLKGYALLRRGQILKSKDPSKSAEDVKAAVRTFEEGLKFYDESVWGHYNLALAYWESGDETRAIEQVKRVLELDPGFKDVVKSDVQFNRFKPNKTFQELIK